MYRIKSRMGLLAGLLATAISAPALAADFEATKAETTLPDQTMIARDAAVVAEGASEPAHSATSLSAKRARAAARASARYSGHAHRNGGGTPLILGIRY